VHNIEKIVRNIERHDDDDQYNNGELAKYKKMIEDSKKSFYHGCVTRYTRLFAMVKFFQLMNGVIVISRTCSHSLRTCYPKAMQSLRPFMRQKQIIYLLDLEVEKTMRARMIALYIMDLGFKDLKKCSICGLGRFNHRKDDGDDGNCNRNRRKGGPKKVFWYFHIIPRLKHWFANKKESELL
jgi:hypothetical protein